MNSLDINLSILKNEDLLLTTSEHIKEVPSSEISYRLFFEEYLHKNRPCLLKNVSQDWFCQKHWIKDGKPDFDYLLGRYGDAEVPVSNCRERYFNAQTKRTMKLNEFLNYWQKYIKQNYDTSIECYYMKDWHFALENPAEDVYQVPQFFASDWINEHLLSTSSCRDDYRFVYMGPKGSWTPLHADVFSSFSWSVNICGRKKWVFYPPGEEDRLRDKFGQLAFDVNGEELNDTDRYPNYSPSVNRIVLFQEVGDAIFVPSGWHHQVWNLEDTISFNHNWINGCNVDKMWLAMTECFLSVTREIADCRDMDNWDDQCQLLLKSCFGMDFSDFYSFIAQIANSRIDRLTEGEELRVNGGWALSAGHMTFDLVKIKSLLAEMIASEIPNFGNSIVDARKLIDKIDCVTKVKQ